LKAVLSAPALISRRLRFVKSCLVLGAALFVSGSLVGCKRFQRKHIPVESVQELGYPTCNGKPLPAGTELWREHLRSGPQHVDKRIVEYYALRQRDCVSTLTVRQEWPLGTADVEVVYDQDLLPLRVWKRMTLPGIERAGERAEIRRYELRTDPVTIKLREMDGHIRYENLLGGRPRVIIGPGRGMISVWIRRAKLKVGEKVRELALDIRALEKIEPVTLQREVDMQHPELGAVQVYTFYGRETVFVDAQGLVVGDLAGLRADRVLTTERPPALPVEGTVDPVNTP
jgi:hypothetical protein